MSWIPKSFLSIPIDKFVHFLMFLPYSFLVFGAFKNKHFWVLLIHILCTGILLAIITEYSQALLTVNRTPELTDLLADIIAITTGVITIVLLKNKFIRNRK
jgi:VanZ family protein